jgi:hypothetical protein
MIYPCLAKLQRDAVPGEVGRTIRWLPWREGVVPVDSGQLHEKPGQPDVA